MISLDQVCDKVSAVWRAANEEGDAEKAHGLENECHRAVLQAISEGAVNPQALAMAALSTANVEFERHCA